TEQLLRSQQEFVADASHQLRTPLTALRLRLENLDHELGADGRSTLTAAVAVVDRLAALVEQLLALARADSAAEPVAEIDVASLLRERAGAWSALAEEHGLAFELGADRPGRALAGAERLRNALDTLIENAIQASPPGGR